MQRIRLAGGGLVMLTGLLAVAGCQAPQTRIVGMSVQGRPLECLELGRGSDVVLILAAIHGSESAGTPLVQRLAEELRARPALLKGRRVVLMPLANPDGFAAHTRQNANGVDLNRNYPASNFRKKNTHGDEPLSEPESRALVAVLDRYQPHRIVSIHQPLACIDYDGPAEELARAMSACTDLPLKKLGSRPGSLGSYAGVTLGIPIVTLELPASARDWDAEAQWSAYGRALLAAVCYPQAPPK